MTSRELPRSEYAKLRDTTIGGVLAAIPDDGIVVVVEDGDRIVGHAVLLRVVHVHGLWIDETATKTGTATRLWRRLVASARSMGATTSVMTDCDSEELRTLLVRAGAQAFPYQPYIVPIGVA